jgi:hypothetical protein
MRVGKLKALIANLDDDMPILVPCDDHEYCEAGCEISTALNFKGRRYNEDHGDEVTPSEFWGERVQVLIVSP